MSAFGAKRKARVIAVEDAEDIPGANVDTETPRDQAEDQDGPRVAFSSRNTKKGLRPSGLRRNFTPNASEAPDTKASTPDDDEDGPAVIRPQINRAGSSKLKKKPPPKSKLSFGADAGHDDAEDGDSAKTTLNQKATQNSALKRVLGNRNLPFRSAADDDDRPKYSREYLDELQSSTPNTPQNASRLPSEVGDEMELDASELDGALIVESAAAAPSVPNTMILSEAEIKERKERRARLAKEKDFISFEDEEEDGDGRKKKDETRLVADEEELGEGFDDYVEDGGLSLGKKAEKERIKHERQKMAAMINAAEGGESDSSADSDAERRIAYEAAQSRAGLDGLKKPRKTQHDEQHPVPPKITPLPSLTECIGRLQVSLMNMEKEVKAKAARVEQLKAEKLEIAKREAEVQALLDETGKKYQAAMGMGHVQNGAAIHDSGAAPAPVLMAERGLESLGTTPRHSDMGDVEGAV